MGSGTPSHPLGALKEKPAWSISRVTWRQPLNVWVIGRFWAWIMSSVTSQRRLTTWVTSGGAQPTIISRFTAQWRLSGWVTYGRFSARSQDFFLKASTAQEGRVRSNPPGPPPGGCDENGISQPSGRKFVGVLKEIFLWALGRLAPCFLSILVLPLSPNPGR